MHPAESSELRRWYFLGSSSALATLIILRLVIFPEDPEAPTWKATLGSLSDSLIAGLVTSIGIALAYVVLAPRLRPRLREIAPADIATVLQKGTSGCQHYQVRSRTANYFTKQTLPTLISNSQRERTPLSVRMLVLDPSDNRLMEQYAHFRQEESAGKRLWTPTRVRLELYASLARAVDAIRAAPRSEIEVCFSRAFWAVSFDFNAEFGLITGQYKGDPAVLIEKSDRRFRMWQDEFDTSYSLGRRVDLRQIVNDIDSFDGTVLESDDVIKTLVRLLGLPALSDDDCRQLSLLNEKPHHYA